MTGHVAAQTEQQSWSDGYRRLSSLATLPLSKRSAEVMQLLRDPHAAIRGRAVAIGAVVLSDDQIASFLRQDGDDTLRSCGLEMLMQSADRGVKLGLELLRDPDPDVVLLAVLALDRLCDQRAFDGLRELLDYPCVNVAQAAIVALGHLGDKRILAELLPFLDDVSWLQMAAVQALGDLGDSQSIPHLVKLMSEPLVGSLAAEAIARIGGEKAFLVLADHWMASYDDGINNNVVELMAEVLENLPQKPQTLPIGFVATLGDLVQKTQSDFGLAAARCLLVVDSGGADLHCAIERLAASERTSGDLPDCLQARIDLVYRLLAMDGDAKSWGFRLVARFPGFVSARDLARAVRTMRPGDSVESVVYAIETTPDPCLAEALLDLFLSIEPSDRELLAPALSAHRKTLLEILEQRFAEIDPIDRVVLAAHLGEPVAAVRRLILALKKNDRSKAIPQLCLHRSVLRGLPWNEWVIEDPEIFAPLAASVAVKCRIQDLIPVLQEALVSKTDAAVIRSLGELGDVESIPILINSLSDASQLDRVVILDALGQLGGPEVRAVLSQHAHAADPSEARVAVAALARCAVSEDMEYFKSLARCSDWVVRQACAEALSRFPEAENMDSLLLLAADPVPAVMKSALSAFDA
jgi:HEAT repeat protein